MGYTDIKKQKGFTLIEIAIVLVIIGILLSIGTGMIGTLTKRAKLSEAREVVKAARESVIGSVVKNGYLPANLETAGARKLDAWGNDLAYYPTSEFDASPEDACGVNATGMEVYECLTAACETGTEGTDYRRKTNIAFVVYSKGFDANGAGTGTVSPFKVRLQDVTYTDGGTTYNYDDVVKYVSLDEIRSLRGCLQTLTITSPNSLPQGEEDSFYSFSMEAIGGKPPYTWGDGSLWSDPAGLLLNASGLISGTLNYNASSTTGELANCSETITIPKAELKVTDSASASFTSTSDFTISVRPKPLKIITDTLPAAYEGSPYSATITASGGKIPYSWSMSVSPSCPTGLTCSSNTISGTPDICTAGTYTVTSTVSYNGTCPTQQTKAFNLTINSPACSGNNIALRNSTGSTRWYRRSGGACTSWSNGSDLTVSPSDFCIRIYTNSTCTTQCATTNYCNQRSYDADNDYKTRMNSPCTFADD